MHRRVVAVLVSAMVVLSIATLPTVTAAPDDADVTDTLDILERLLIQEGYSENYRSDDTVSYHDKRGNRYEFWVQKKWASVESPEYYPNEDDGIPMTDRSYWQFDKLLLWEYAEKVQGGASVEIEFLAPAPDGGYTYIIFTIYVGTTDRAKTISEMAFDRLLATAIENGHISGSADTDDEASLIVESGYTGVATDGASRLTLTASFPEEVYDFDAVAENPQTGAAIPGLTIEHEGADRAMLTFDPVELHGDPPYPVEVLVSAEARGGTVYTATANVEVVRPSVLLIHGIWSDKSSMTPMAVALDQTQAFPHTRLIDYGSDGTSSKDLRVSAKQLHDGVEAELDYLEGRGIKAERVNIVAHSMGGLISRYYISYGYNTPGGDLVAGTAGYDKVRNLVTLDTPHAGSPVADWYVTTWDHRMYGCMNSAEGRPVPKPLAVPNDLEQWKENPEMISSTELYWLLGLIHKLDGDMRKDALVYGQALRQLQTPDRKDSIVPILREGEADRRAAGDLDGILYHQVAGNQPLTNSFAAWVAPTALQAAYPYDDESIAEVRHPALSNLGPCGEYYRPEGAGSLINGFIERVTLPESDGVVEISSQLDPVVGDRVGRTFPENHFTITKSPAVYRYVMQRFGVEPPERVYMDAFSPGTLHVYNQADDHVGLTGDGPETGIEGATYVRYEDMLGVHEQISLPAASEGEYVAGFVPHEVGQVTLRTTTSHADGVEWYAYEGITVDPESISYVLLDADGETAEVVYQNDSSTVIEPDRGGTQLDTGEIETKFGTPYPEYQLTETVASETPAAGIADGGDVDEGDGDGAFGIIAMLLIIGLPLLLLFLVVRRIRRFIGGLRGRPN